MRKAVRLDRNLTVARSGLPADAFVRLFYWDKGVIVDVVEAPMSRAILYHNQIRTFVADDGWAATIELAPARE